jgi:hypothetical protein
MTGRRPFTLLDSLVLLAATAWGLAMTRDFPNLLTIVQAQSVVYAERRDGDPPARMTSFKAALDPRDIASGLTHRTAVWAGTAVYWPGPCLAAWTLAVLILSFVNPGAPAREVLGRPGVVAGLAWVVGLTAAAVSTPGALIGRVPPGLALTAFWREWWFLTWFDLPRGAGFAVAVSWLTLCLCGRFAPRGEWPDRLGVILGLSWMALGSLSLALSWLFALS